MMAISFNGQLVLMRALWFPVILLWICAIFVICYNPMLTMALLKNISVKCKIYSLQVKRWVLVLNVELYIHYASTDSPIWNPYPVQSCLSIWGFHHRLRCLHPYTNHDLKMSAVLNETDDKWQNNNPLKGHKHTRKRWQFVVTDKWAEINFPTFTGQNTMFVSEVLRQFSTDAWTLLTAISHLIDETSTKTERTPTSWKILKVAGNVELETVSV